MKSILIVFNDSSQHNILPGAFKFLWLTDSINLFLMIRFLFIRLEKFWYFFGKMVQLNTMSQPRVEACVRHICTNQHLCQFIYIYINEFPAFPMLIWWQRTDSLNPNRHVASSKGTSDPLNKRNDHNVVQHLTTKASIYLVHLSINSWTTLAVWTLIGAQAYRWIINAKRTEHPEDYRTYNKKSIDEKVIIKTYHGH